MYILIDVKKITKALFRVYGKHFPNRIMLTCWYKKLILRDIKTLHKATETKSTWF